ncbi:peptide chain release factor N(5)-glutamine methyltransferase [bacterium]|nr:peptide chain release factor N(5)-glutamine methyltransferase [bacterium]
MLIQEIEQILINSGIEPNEAKIEIKLLLEYFANFSLIDILTGKKLDDAKLKLVEEKARLRASTHQPIQYIIGEADFMGEKFKVDKSVLIPRDETEILVRETIKLVNENNCKSVLDMCTGSGCIACMIAKLTNAQVIGTDISTEALHIAFSNMEKMELFNKASFRKSDLYSKIREDEKFDIIVSNPPYIPPKEKQTIQKEVSFEPDIALFTKDEKGLEFYEKIIQEAPKYLNNNGHILFELGIGQSQDVAKIMLNNGFENIEIIKDLASIDRVISGKIK